jgi:hypothetical protein
MCSIPKCFKQYEESMKINLEKKDIISVIKYLDRYNMKLFDEDRFDTNLEVIENLNRLNNIFTNAIAKDSSCEDCEEDCMCNCDEDYAFFDDQKFTLESFDNEISIDELNHCQFIFLDNVVYQFLQIWNLELVYMVSAQILDQNHLKMLMIMRFLLVK